MTRRDFVGSLIAAPLVAAAMAQGGRRPLNFVLFLLDDLGWTDLGCTGSSFYETPGIDRLAAQGMLFTDAYAACPVCSPTRAALLTGKYPARLKLTDYLVGTRSGKMLPAEYIDHLPLEEVTLAEALHAAGYATGFVGKWHLGGPPYYPEHQGFDSNVGGCELGHPPSYFYPYSSDGGRVPIDGGTEGEYLTDRLTDEALKFLDRSAGRPYFLHFCHYAVHNPQQAKAEDIAHYEPKAAALGLTDDQRYAEWRGRRVRQAQDSPVYAAMIHSVDESVRRVLAKLDQLGVADDTMVIFTSDNGGLSTSEGTPTSNLPLRAGKGWLFEGGTRVPLIVRGPGVTAGTASAVPVTSTDFYPTMLSLADLPARPTQHVDGQDLSAALLRRGTPPTRPLFWHYPHYSNQGSPPCGSVRLGEWKLIEWYEDGSVELYNVAEDVTESRELSSQHAAKTAELRDMLHDWRASVGANMPRPKPES